MNGSHNGNHKLSKYTKLLIFDAFTKIQLTSLSFLLLLGNLLCYIICHSAIANLELQSKFLKILTQEGTVMKLPV